MALQHPSPLATHDPRREFVPALARRSERWAIRVALAGVAARAKGDRRTAG